VVENDLTNRGNEAAQECILEALRNGPLLSDELLSACGFDPDRHSLEELASGTDGATPWTNSPYYASLTFLVKTGVVKWRHRDDLSTEYGLASQIGEEAAERSPIVLALRRLFDDLAERLGVPSRRPFFNVFSVRDVTDKRTISLAYNGEQLELCLYDFEGDVGTIAPLFSWSLPITSLGFVGIVDSIQQLRDPPEGGFELKNKSK